MDDTKSDICSFFPEEVWLLILEKLDSSSLHTCSLSLNGVKKLLEASKSKWMFTSIFPYIVSQLDKKDVLNCRLVCKRWRTGVNHYWETFSHTNFDPFHVPRNTHSFLFRWPLTRFNRRILGPSGPLNLPGGSAILTDLDQVPPEICNVLPNLKNLRLCSKYNRQRPFYPVVQQILSMSGLVHSLSIHDDITGYLENRETNVENPLPTLPHLTVLSTHIHPNSWIDSKLLHAYSKQLVKVTLREWSGTFNQLPWDSLVYLEVKVDPDGRLYNSLRSLDANKLQHLTVPFDSKLEQIVTLTRHISVANLCLKTKSSFRGIPVTELDSVSVPAPAHLKTLCLKSFPFADYAFLAAFRNVPTIKIAIHEDNLSHIRKGYYDSFELYDLLKNGDSLYKSDIWKTLPGLNNLEVWMFESSLCKHYYYRSVWNRLINE